MFDTVRALPVAKHPMHVWKNAQDPLSEQIFLKVRLGLARPTRSQ